MVNKQVLLHVVSYTLIMFNSLFKRTQNQNISRAAYVSTNVDYFVMRDASRHFRHKVFIH